jgi:hypothetical protein
VALVKGPVVAEAYPAPDLRPYHDLDLLVASADVSTLLSLLKRAGYTFSMDGIRGWHLPPLHPPENQGFKIDVHTALARDQQGNSLFTWETWRDSMSAWSRFPDLKHPASVEHMLYLVHHLVVHHHFEMGVLPLSDLVFMTTDWSASRWQQLADLAAYMNMRRAVGLSLHLADWWYGKEQFKEGRVLFPSPPSLVFTQSQRLLLGTRQTARLKFERDVGANSISAWLRHGWRVLAGDPDAMRGLTWQDRLHFYLRRPLHLLRSYGPWASSGQKKRSSVHDVHEAQRDLMDWLRGAD